MEKRQLTALCVCTMAIYAGVGGLIGLMPVYLTRLGADPASIGLFLASAYLALALSNVVAGRVSHSTPRRRRFLIISGLLLAPVAWLMSRAATVGSLWVLMTSLWFALGFPMTLANILVGLGSAAETRGRNFGLLALCSGLGLFLGGLASGPIVDRRGFPALFAAFAGFSLLVPLAGWFVRDHHSAPGQGDAPSLRHITGERAFAILFTASIIAQAANIVIFLSRPLLMDTLHFDATTISRAAALGSLVTLPLPLAIGWLADRLGRKALIVVCFLAPPLGLLGQRFAVHPWQFGLSSTLSTILGFSIVIGLSAGGALIRAVQITTALPLAALLGLLALLLLLFLPGTKARQCPAKTRLSPAAQIISRYPAPTESGQAPVGWRTGTAWWGWDAQQRDHR